MKMVCPKAGKCGSAMCLHRFPHDNEETCCMEGRCGRMQCVEYKPERKPATKMICSAAKLCPAPTCPHKERHEAGSSCEGACSGIDRGIRRAMCIEAPELPTGWLCPACGKGNAPDVKQCPCEGKARHSVHWQYLWPCPPAANIPSVWIGQQPEMTWETTVDTPQGWISVKDKLPATDKSGYSELVLVGWGMAEKSSIVLARYYRDGTWCSQIGDGLVRIAHWMPLPEGPKERQ